MGDSAPQSAGADDSLQGFKSVTRLLRGILEAASGITPEIKAKFSDESLCRRCGKCCFCGIKLSGRMIMLKDLPCKFLEFNPDGTTSCSVYKHKELTGWCYSMCPEAIRKELFVSDCPYVRDIPGYRGKVELSDREFEQAKPALRKIFKEFPKPDYVKHGDWQRFIHDTLSLPEKDKPIKTGAAD